jgi:hypothetical protein
MNTVLDEFGVPVYPYQRANGFPIFPSENLVDRQSFVETVERMFSEVQVVFLEGEEGFGTTTTAAQFCISYPESSFCIFIKPSSRTTYSPDYLRLTLSEQIVWFLDGCELAEDSIGPVEFRKLIIRLGRKTSKNKPVYFVVDGLHKVQNADQIIDEIFRDILPFWQDNIKFLICGKQAYFERHIVDLSYKYIHQLTLSSQEVQRFMLPVSIDENDVRTLHLLCKGIPGRLASVRRLMIGGMTLNEILSSTPEKFPSFVKLEFAQVNALSNAAKKILATITFSGRQFGREDLIALTGTNDSAIAEVLTSCHFVSEADTGGKIDFVSEAHRRFASTLLAQDKNDIITRNVEYLLKNPNSRDAVNYIPIYFQQLNQAAELIGFLTPEHFSHLLQHTSSLGAVRARSRIGMAAAVTLERPNDVVAFSLIQSVFLSIAKSEGSIAQIRALVSLGEHQTALGIAYNCVTNEERLKFLSTYAKKCKEVTKTVDAEVIAAIQVAAKSVNFSQLGDAAIDIASDIVHVDQDMALAIMDEVLKGAPVSARDAALVKMSLATPIGEGGRSDNRSCAQIKDIKLQVFVSSILALMSDYTYKDIIETSDKLDQSRQLSYLAYWLSEHKSDDGAVDVIEHGLKIMIGNSAHVPRMREFRGLAVALPFCSDIARVENLVKRFDSQRGLISDVAISLDTVGLQMALAHAETRYDHSAAASRVLDCYIELGDTNDADTKLQGFSLMLRVLHEIDQDNVFEKENKFKETIRADLAVIVSEVLANSADHFLIMKDVISEFAHFDLPEAIRLAQLLNTEDRRNRAFERICIALQEREISSQMVSEVCGILPYLTDVDERSNIFSDFVHNLTVRKAKLDEPSINLIESVLQSVADSYLHPKSIISACRLRTLAGLETSVKLMTWFNQAITNVIAIYYQSDLYFDMSDATANASLATAKEFYRLGTDKLASTPIPTKEYTQILTWCLTFCARAIGGAIAGGSFRDDMLSRFLQLVELLPAVPTKISVVCDLASRMWIAGREDLAKSLIGQQVIPVVDAALISNESNGYLLTSLCAPVLYCTHPQIAISKIKKLSRNVREPILTLAFDLLHTKVPKTDPSVTDIKDSFFVTYDEVLSAISLIELMEEDWNLYSATHQLVASIVHKRNSNNITSQQKNDIADKLKDIYCKRLPDPHNIRHEGYLILCDAQDLRLRSVLTVPHWDALIDRARAVTNIADRGYVLCEISGLLPSKMTVRKNEVRIEALSLFNQVPSAIDKINRLINLSDGSSKDAISIAKQSLKAAMLMTLHMSDENVARGLRRRIIDIADKIKPEFADELADAIDQDEARKAARLEVKQRVSMLAVKKKISDVKSCAAISHSEVKHLPEASWKNLHSLIGDRLEIKSPIMMADYLEQSSNFTLQEAVPVLSWFIENVTRKYAADKDSAGHIRTLADGLLTAAEFSANSMTTMAAKNNHFAKIPIGDLSISKLLGLNNRVEMLRFIEEWLSDCDEDVILCDPYFGAKENDLEFFRLMLRACPNCEVVILTSKEIMQKQNISSEEIFLEKWRQVCELDPPVGRVVSIGAMKNSASIIHDRWLISGSRGLKLGTSFNGIGTGKLSGISVLSDGELLQSKNEIMKFVNGDRYIDGERVSYSSFTI